MEQIIKNIIDTPNTFVGELPIDIDVAQAIHSTTGQSAVYFGKDTYAHLYYTIYVRGLKNEETHNRVNTIYNKVKNYTGLDFSIIISRTPYFVGRDSKDRSVYAFQIEYQLGGY